MVFQSLKTSSGLTSVSFLYGSCADETSIILLWFLCPYVHSTNTCTCFIVGSAALVTTHFLFMVVLQTYMQTKKWCLFTCHVTIHWLHKRLHWLTAVRSACVPQCARSPSRLIQEGVMQNRNVRRGFQVVVLVPYVHVFFYHPESASVVPAVPQRHTAQAVTECTNMKFAFRV